MAGAVPAPTLTGFIAFIRGVMRIPSSVLPDNAPIIEMAFDVALETVYLQLRAISPLFYNLATYNLGGDLLVNYAPDEDGAPNVEGSDPPMPYFAFLRSQMNITGPVTGVVQATSDEATSTTLLVPEALKTLTLANLQNMKTPWGRAYLGIAQRTGTLWGLT